MIVCACNSFNDKAVREFLATITDRATTVRETYPACSGGREPDCGKCMKRTLKELVDEHNAGITSPRALPAP